MVAKNNLPRAPATPPHLISKDLQAAKTATNKGVEEFRNYKTSCFQERVSTHYRLMRRHQTVEFYRKMEDKYSFEGGRYRALMTIREAFTALEKYVDSSDPDLDLPNLTHMIQTAEGIRRAGHPDWMVLVGLLHDMGKIQFLWGTAEEGQQGTADGAQWALGGDTWVLGCLIPDSVVFPEYSSENPDACHPIYSSKTGMYEEHVGLDNLLFAWGHDEYMYRMLVANGTTIPKEGLAMVRYHSAYPLHEKGEYRHLLKNEDEDTIHWVRLFNTFDLYTKDQDNDGVDVEELWPYYQALIDKYLPQGPLRWW